MNQILVTNNTNSKKRRNPFINFKKTNFFKFQFVCCTILAFAFSMYYAYYLYDHNQKENFSKKLVSNFNITSLYSSQKNYSATRSSLDNSYETNYENFSVVGLIEINAITINYPILSEITEELLKIAPCKFYGPMPNEIGNLCIAGHNYNNYKFFSRLKKLVIGDIINIYDLSGQKISYEVYSTYETDYNDFTCLNQDTNGKRELTLLTCNNIKNKRRIVKATQKG